MDQPVTEGALPILPAIDPLTAPFWAAARRGELVLQYCRPCAVPWHPPMPRCPHCHNDQIEWRSVEPVGSIYSFTDAIHPVHPALADRVPYRIVLVDLDAGPRLVSAATGTLAFDPDVVGRRVTAVFEAVTPDLTLILFREQGDA